MLSPSLTPSARCSAQMLSASPPSLSSLALSSKHRQPDNLHLARGGLLGVTLSSQASKVVEAVSDFLLASRCALAVSPTTPSACESEAPSKPTSSLASARCQMSCCTVTWSFHASGRWESQRPRHRIPAPSLRAARRLRISDRSWWASLTVHSPPQRQRGWLSCFIRLLTLAHTYSQSSLLYRLQPMTTSMAEDLRLFASNIEFPLETTDYRFQKPIVHPAAANARCTTVTTVRHALPFPKTTSCSCADWHIERSLRSNIDIGMVHRCTCVSGDALATLKLNHVLLQPASHPGQDIARPRQAASAHKCVLTLECLIDTGTPRGSRYFPFLYRRSANDLIQYLTCTEHLIEPLLERITSHDTAARPGSLPMKVIANDFLLVPKP